MGGRVPLGYDLKDRKLIVNPAEAKQVRRSSARTLRLAASGSSRRIWKNIVCGSKVRTGYSGQEAGDGSHSRGGLYKLLANRIYIGEISHKENAYPGEHEAIIGRELWESVRAKLAENHRARRHRTNASEPSLLSGLIFDQDGCRYTPSHAVKNGKRYRYYVSRKIIHGRSAGSTQPGRIPARELEQLVLTELASFFGSADRVTAMLGPADEDLETTRALVERCEAICKRL